MGGLLLGNDSSLWFKNRGQISNMNNAKESGIYHVNVYDAEYETNIPIGASKYGVLLVFKSAGLYTVQMFVSLFFVEGTKIFIRNADESGTFQEWSYVS